MKRWLAQEAEFAREEMTLPPDQRRPFVDVLIRCMPDQGGCGVTFGPWAKWIDRGKEENQEVDDTVRRMPCLHCGRIGTAGARRAPVSTRADRAVPAEHKRSDGPTREERRQPGSAPSTRKIAGWRKILILPGMMVLVTTWRRR